MDFRKLLNVADSNKEAAEYEAKVKRYSTDLPPPKKLSKSNVLSDGVRKFLEKKKQEEEARAAAAQKKKEELLALRAQSSKNNKKAKIMASRTKDNDFSKIRLTEDEIESKKKIEIELQRKHLADKVERMKARIEMEEKEKLLPRKRKRKTKLNGEGENIQESSQDEELPMENIAESKDFHKNDKPPKPKKAPAPPPMSFSELLKIASTKQHEPVVIQKKKKVEDRPLSKKERKLYDEEQERIRRTRERLERGESLLQPKPSKVAKPVPSTEQKKLPNGKTKSPVVIHVEKDSGKGEAAKVKLPKPPDSSKSGAKATSKPKPPSESSKNSTFKNHTNHDREGTLKNTKDNRINAKPGSKGEKNEDRAVTKKAPSGDKSIHKKSSVKAPPAPVAPVIDADAIAEAIEKRLREKFEKEMEERLAARLESINKEKVVQAPPKPAASKMAPYSGSNGKIAPKPNGVPRKIEQRPPEKISKPSKRPFHINPYLEPPRRLLEPQRSTKPPIRRIESDEEEEEDDDMSDFIDDSTCQNDEDYSKYIRDVFGYDKNKFIDFDDDDIQETGYFDQQKEELKSAKIGFMEDLEEERKLREMEKRQKMKRKK